MNDEQWSWQDKGTAWYGIGIYHVTLTIPNREALLGTLVIPNNDPMQARIERTELGNALVDTLLAHPSFYPEIRILQFCLMPDHLHAIIHVTRPMNTSIRSVVRSFWQGAKKLGKAYSLSLEPESDSGTNNKEEQSYPFPIFTERPFIRVLTHHGQLQTMYDYIRMNPQRLATKHLMPEYFRVQEGLEIAGQKYQGVGNVDLLQRAQYVPVHVRGIWVDNAEKHGDNKQLRDYMNGCIVAARKGAVMVSPFINKYEQMVMDELLKEGLPFIYIADNGFRNYYKPQDRLFDAVARKQVIIISPWEYDPHKKRVSRADCVAMNKMAERICSLSLEPESDSGTNNKE